MSNTPYQGKDILDVTADAKDYNSRLIREILRAAGNPTTAVDFGAGTFSDALRDHGRTPPRKAREASTEIPYYPDLVTVSLFSSLFSSRMQGCQKRQNNRQEKSQ